MNDKIRFSITVPVVMKVTLEQLADDNFRTLNGEINKALDFYIKNCDAVITPKEQSKETDPVIDDVSSIDDFEDVEIDEF